MNKNIILRLALPTPIRRLFDYLPPDDISLNGLIPGIRLKVPFQSRTLIGVLIEIVKESSIPNQKLKKVLSIVDAQPLFSADIYQLCLWSAEYYHCALGEVLAHALPSLLRADKQTQTKKNICYDDFKSQNSSPIPLLNPAQLLAIANITASEDNFKVFLLDGITGSGKTEVYLHAIATMLKHNKQVLVLVPEISLTPQTTERFRRRFDQPIATLHSNLSNSERLQVWSAAQTGKLKIVIGTRSAIFTPFKNLGLIVVDEEHDHSFKQQDRFRYHARDMAVMRARLNNIPIVLGSATPSLESQLNVKRHRYDYLSLPQRTGKAQLPRYQIIDLNQTPTENGLSQPLLQAIRDHLSQDNQVILFLNRRGFAPVLFCTTCHHVLQCQRCDARMVYHYSPQRLHCHYCDARCSIPNRCEKCHEESLLPIGIGTQKL